VKVDWIKKYEKNNLTISENYITVSDGVKLLVTDFAPAPDTDKNENIVIVFVAGWISHISGWHDVLKALSREFRVLYVETREKKSALLPKKNVVFTVERMALDLAEVVNSKLGKEKFCFAGSSLGSAIIFDYLTNKDELFHKPEASILISPISDFDYPLWAKIVVKYCPASVYSVIKHPIAWYFAVIKVDRKKEPEQAEKYNNTIKSAEASRLKKNAKALEGYSIWENLGKIDSKVILLGAGTDKLHGIKSLKKMQAKIKNSEIELLASNKETHSDVAGKLIVQKIIDL
jgi:pimeloyl-ACP methyl ester carboxylesterase